MTLLITLLLHLHSSRQATPSSVASSYVQPNNKQVANFLVAPAYA